MFTQAVKDLPFVDATATEVLLWSVQPTGDYSTDCATGARYARAMLTVIRTHQTPQLLGNVVCAMPPRAKWTGIEIGFLTEIATRAV